MEKMRFSSGSALKKKKKLTVPMLLHRPPISERTLRRVALLLIKLAPYRGQRLQVTPTLVSSLLLTKKTTTYRTLKAMEILGIVTPSRQRYIDWEAADRFLRLATRYLDAKKLEREISKKKRTFEDRKTGGAHD